MAKRSPTERERIERFSARGDEIAWDTGIDTKAAAQRTKKMSDEELAAETMQIAGQTEDVVED